MANAPATPFQKLAAAFEAAPREEAREGGLVEVFPVARKESQIEVSLSRGVAPCLSVRAQSVAMGPRAAPNPGAPSAPDEEPPPSSTFRKNVLLRTRNRLVYPRLVARRVSSLDRVNALLALRSDTRTGDADFDRGVTIEADFSDEVIAQTFASKAARDAALVVVGAGFTLLFEDRAIRADLPAPAEGHVSAATVGPVIEALDTLVATAPRSDPAAFSKRPQLGRVLAGAIIVIGLIAAGSLAPGAFDDPGSLIRPLPHPLVPMPMMIPGLLAGAAAFVPAFLLLRFWLKRRNASTDLPLVMALLVVLMTLGVGGLDAVNRLFDDAPLAVHDAKILSKDTSKSRKSDGMSKGTVTVSEGGVTDWLLAVSSWRPGVAELEVSVSPNLHRTARVGDTLRVTVHPGFLGWEWGAAVELGQAAPQ